MPPVVGVNPETLEELKGEAASRAQQLGHHLLAFRTAKHDPLCHVAFCADCRQMVLITLDPGFPKGGRLLGYALETRCVGVDATTEKILDLVASH